MEAFAASLEGLALAEWLRYSRWGYALLNATHILGLALLVGAIITLDLRLIGFWRDTVLPDIYRAMSCTAASGLVVAVITGVVLFSVRATEYIQLPLFFVKLGLIATAMGYSAFLHLRYDIASLGKTLQRRVGLMSLCLWLGVLISGRMLAFV